LAFFSHYFSNHQSLNPLRHWFWFTSASGIASHRKILTVRGAFAPSARKVDTSDANEKPVLTFPEQKELERLRAQSQKEVKRLQQELRRKDKALAEAAALLLVAKKIQAFWGEDADD
jgi:hypothetical protein